MKKLFYQCCEPNEIVCYTNPNLKFSIISFLLEITHNVIKFICNSMCLNGDKKNLINTFYRIVMITVIIKSNMIIPL